MLTAIVLSLLGAALVVVLWAMFRPPERARPSIQPMQPVIKGPAGKALDSADPWNAKPGDVISILGAAEDFSDLDFPVDRRSAYESGKNRWVDLSGEFRGRRIYLEVYRHPIEDYLGLLDARKLSLPEIAVTEDQLADMDTRQDPAAYIEFEGKKWNFESSREIAYFENETGAADGLYRWLFKAQNVPQLLCIEKWAGEPFDIRIARRLNKADINIYRAA